MYASAIKESDLLLFDEKERGEGNILKMLICQGIPNFFCLCANVTLNMSILQFLTSSKNAIEWLSNFVYQERRKIKLWIDVKNFYKEISKHVEQIHMREERPG